MANFVKVEKNKFEKSPWCGSKKVLRQLVRLELDIKSNEKRSDVQRKKIIYLEELMQFIKLIDFSRGNVKFRLMSNARIMARCMLEMNFIIGEDKIQIEECSLVPKKCANQIYVLRVEDQTLVLIECG